MSSTRTGVKRHWRSFLLAFALVGALLVPTAASAKTDKVDVCHVRGNGSSIVISVSVNALQAHLDHGDTEGTCGDDDDDE